MCRLLGKYKHRTKIWYRLMVDTYLHKLMNILKNCISFIHIRHFSDTLFISVVHILLLCAQYQVHFCSVCKNHFTFVNLYCNIVHVANFFESESQQGCSILDDHIMPTQAQKSSQTLHHGLQNKIFALSGKLGCHVLPNTWNIPPNHPTQHSHPTFCRSCHGPRICCRHALARKSIVSSCLCLSWLISGQQDESERVYGKYWSRITGIFKLRSSVPHEYFPHYVYKRFLYI